MSTYFAIADSGDVRFEQLELRLAHRHEVRPNVLRRDFFGRLDLEAKRVAIERERRRQILHRDADAIEDSRRFCARIRLCAHPRAAAGGRRVWIDPARRDAIDDGPPARPGAARRARDDP